MRRTRELATIARLELADVLRSRWLLFAFGAYGLLAAVFVLVGLRESAVFGFTGLGRVFLSFYHALLLLLPLMGLVASGQAVGRARDEGTLEFLLSQPIGRGMYFSAISLVRLLVLAGPLAVLVLGVALYGQLVLGQPVPWGFLGRSLLICTSLLVAFVGLGMAVSTLVRHPARATMYLVLLWALAIAFLDFGLIGLMLKWRLNPQLVFLLAAVNPVEAARLALLSGLTPELGTLGPVGFYLATRLGGALLFVAGTAWPAVVGLTAWLVAHHRFRTGDIV